MFMFVYRKINPNTWKESRETCNRSWQMSLRYPPHVWTWMQAEAAQQTLADGQYRICRKRRGKKKPKQQQQRGGKLCLTASGNPSFPPIRLQWIKRQQVSRWDAGDNTTPPPPPPETTCLRVPGQPSAPTAFANNAAPSGSA